jgi:hypothetical protein
MTQQSLMTSWLPPALCAADQCRMVVKRATTIQGLYCSQPRAACSRTLATSAIQGVDATNHDRHIPHVHWQQRLSKADLTKPRAASHTSLAVWFSTWTAKSDVFLVLVRVNRGCSVWRSWPLMYVSVCGQDKDGREFAPPIYLLAKKQAILSANRCGRGRGHGCRKCAPLEKFFTREKSLDLGQTSQKSRFDWGNAKGFLVFVLLREAKYVGHE